MTLTELRKLAEEVPHDPRWVHIDDISDVQTCLLVRHVPALLDVAEAVENFTREATKNIPETPVWLHKLEDALMRLRGIE